MTNYRFNIREVKVGDEITINDRYSKEEFSKWRITSKLDQTLLMIERTVKGIIENKMIDISEVRSLNAC